MPIAYGLYGMHNLLLRWLRSQLNRQCCRYCLLLLLRGLLLLLLLLKLQLRLRQWIHIVEVQLTQLQTLRQLLRIDARRSNQQPFRGSNRCCCLSGTDGRNLIGDTVQAEQLLCAVIDCRQLHITLSVVCRCRLCL